MKKRLRADERLVEQGLCDSLSLARTLILAGKVYLPFKRIDKASELLPQEAILTVTQPPRYVSRGAEKLEGFFKAHPLDVTGLIALDIGASTGGFTDYLLQHGASHVTCVDVGHGQLHSKIAQDSRIKNFEKINARTLEAVLLPHLTYDVVVMDLSFISLTRVLPSAWLRVKNDGHLIALIKPQFEASKAEVDKNRGVIMDPVIRQRIVDSITNFCQTQLQDSTVIGVIASPLSGADGNQEYLLGLTKKLDKKAG